MRIKITFGQDHEIFHNREMTLGFILPYFNGWIEIEAPDYESARSAAFRVFGDQWAFTYPEKKEMNHNPAGCLAVIYLDHVYFPRDNSKLAIDKRGQIVSELSVFDTL